MDFRTQELLPDTYGYQEAGIITKHVWISRRRNYYQTRIDIRMHELLIITRRMDIKTQELLPDT